MYASLSRLFQWALSVDETLAELEHTKEELSQKGLALAAMKMRNIVKENYPMTRARPELNDRDTLDALLVCDIVLPPVDPVWLPLDGCYSLSLWPVHHHNGLQCEYAPCVAF